MEKIDQILLKIYTILDRAVEFFKHITRLEIMTKINEMSRKIHSSLIVLAMVFVAIFGIYFSIQLGGGQPIGAAVLSILGFLVISYLAKDFHGACESLISANGTTLSNHAILRFSAIVSVLAAALLFLAFLASFFRGEISDSIMFLFYALLLYMSAGTLFNPSLININVSSDSSSGEDFITIFSSGLKTFVYFERIISSVLILSGTIRFIEIILGFRDPIIDVTMAFGLIAAGIGFPLLAYLSFTILWFVNSLLLSILSLRRNP
jgi:hypothetical protein